MFYHRASKFDRCISAIAGHLRAIDKELRGMGQSAGRRATAGASVAGNRLTDAIGPILNDIMNRFGRGQGPMLDEAAGYGNDAARIGATFGNEALERITAQAKHRPLSTLAVAVGVGILIGLASKS
jgi:hypothetical protein